MKKKIRIRLPKGKFAWVLAGGLALANQAWADEYQNSQRDPRYATNTIADCVHGGTGIAANMDCSRDRANRHTTDTNAYNTDTAELDGAYLMHSNSPSVDQRDGMTAISQ